ncbi:MAG: alpha/beta fold hydrolase [Pseudomonadales bacterium]
MNAFSSDGCRSVYDVTGRGPPVLLLHGFSQDRRLWSHFGWVETLNRRGFLVINMDLRGCGESDRPTQSARYSAPSHIADVEAVLAACSLEHCTVWGWSFGGTLALHLAAACGSATRALVAGTYFGAVFTDEYVNERMKVTKDEQTRARWQGLRSWPKVEPSDVRCPTTVYSGTNDGNVVVKLEDQRDQIEASNIHLRVFQGLSHGELVSSVEMLEDFACSSLTGSTS